MQDLKLYLGSNHPFTLHTFSDSDWANCLDMHHSMGGYMCSLESGMVPWTAHKQKVVATSSCEAEYIAAFETTKECIWLHILLDSIDYQQTLPTIIYCDNSATKTLSEDPLLHSCVKQINIKYHLIE